MRQILRLAPILAFVLASWGGAARAAPTASVDFAQGGVNPAAGIAICTAVTGTAVTVANGANTGVASWQVDLAYSPPGSALAVGTLAFNNSSATPAATFTPDVTGCYRVVLYVWSTTSRAGAVSSKDIRDVCIPEAGGNGYIVPPDQRWPPLLPLPQSGQAGAQPDELNCPGTGFGWSGNGADKKFNNVIKDASAYLPSATQKQALTGTNGTPGSGNKYVTDSDPRLSGGGGGGLTQLTGPVTAGPGSGSVATSITANAITLGMMAQLPTLTLIGNSTGGTANAAALTMSTLRTMLGLSCTDISSATSAGCALLTAANVAAQQAALSLTPGTNVQAFSANLSAFAGVSLVADRLVYANGTGTLALTTYTAAARTFDAAVDAAAETAILNVFGTTTKGLVPSPGSVSGNCLHDNGGWSACTGSSSVNATTAETTAPATPSAGNVATWVDSTDARFHDKNPAGTIGTTVVADTGAANNVLTAISAAGVISKSQLGVSNLSSSTSAQLATVLSDETGTGANVFATSPTLVTPNLGTASGGDVSAAIPTHSVAVSKIATGTAGNLLTWDASGNPAAVATGTTGQALLSNGAGAAPTFQTLPGGGDALTTNPLSQFAATTSLQLKNVISDETGSGAMVFGTTPTLTTPVLGVATATSVNKLTLTAPATGSTLTIDDGFTLHVSGNATLSGTSSGTNTGDQTVTLTGDATGSGTGSFAVTNVNAPDGFTHAGKAIVTAIAAPATPAAGKGSLYVDSTSKNIALKDDAGNVNHGIRTQAGTANQWMASVANDGSSVTSQPGVSNLASSTSAQLATVLSDETGTGANVFATSPTLVTPVLGAATATTINKLTFTQPATGSTLTLSDGVTLTVPSTLNTSTLAPLASPTFTGTVTIPALTMTGAAAHGNNNITGVKTFSWNSEIDNGNKTGATQNIGDFTAGARQKITLTGNVSSSTWTTPSTVTTWWEKVCQDATGSRTIVWPTSPAITWTNGGTAPTLTTTASACDFVGFYYDGTTVWGIPNSGGSGGGITAGTGDVTFSGTGSVTTTLANIPTAVTAAGTIVHSNIAAPASPASGKVSVYSDSTDLRLHDKNASGTIGTTVVADTGAANNYISAISAAGVITKSQPGVSNLASSTSAQLATVLSDEQGSGAAVFATSPTLTTPVLGVASATSLAMGNGSVTAVKAVTYNGVVDNGNEGGASPALLTWAAGASQKITLTSSITGTPTWTLPTGTQYLALDVCQNGTGGFAMAWPAVTWDGTTAPVIDTTASRCTRVSLRYDGTTVTGSSGALYAKLISPTFTTPTIGAATATSIAMGNGNITAAKAVYLNGKVAGGNKTGATQALFDWTAGSFQTITLTGNVTGTSTCTAPTAAITGLVALVVQDATGSRTVASWCPNTKWKGGTAPTLTTTASRTDRIRCDWDGTNYLCDADLNMN